MSSPGGAVHITVFSSKKVWWLCSKGHEWEAPVSDRSNKHGCPYCAGKRVSNENCLQKRNPSLVKEWHPTKNIGLTPMDVTFSSHKKVWWLCLKGHEWEATVNSRSGGQGCPYCAGKRVNQENCLQARYPSLAREWHPTKNGNLKPINLTTGSHKKAWWLCRKGHEWETTVKDRSRGQGCPYCFRQRRKNLRENISRSQ
ncbi:MAG: zinc-ribbon domain-containing protein [Syntrophales bacterium]